MGKEREREENEDKNKKNEKEKKNGMKIEKKGEVEGALFAQKISNKKEE